MAKMLEKVFKKAGEKGKGKSRNWVKTLGIISVVVWVAAMGGVYALKDMSLAPADTHDKEGHGEKGAEGHGDRHASSEAAAHHSADPVAKPDEGRGEKHAAMHGEKHGDGHADSHATKHAEKHDDSHAKADAKHQDGQGEQHAAKAKDDHGHESVAGHGGHQGESHHGDAKHGDEHAKADHGKAGHADTHAKDAPLGDTHAKPAHGDPHAKAPAPAAHGDSEADDEAITAPVTEDERNALRELAEIHASRGNLEKAVYPLKKLTKEPTKDVALLSLATEVFLGTGHYKQALAVSRKALRYAQPGRVDLLVAKIMAQYRLGQVEEAFKSAKTALEQHPKDLDLLTAQGTMEIEMGPAHPSYGEALEKALKIDPKHVPALYQVGRKAQLEGDYKDAEILFRKVLKLDPKHAKALGQLGTALYNLQKDVEARHAFEAALELNPKDYNTWFNLGESHLATAARETSARVIRDHRKQAMASYLKAVEWNPDHAEAHYRIGVILNGNSQFKEAIRHLDAARKVDGSHVPTLIQLAVAYENLKRPDRAKSLLEQAAKLDPSDKIVQFKLKHST